MVPPFSKHRVPDSTSSSKNALLKSLAALASILANEQLTEFSERLVKALQHLSEHSMRPAEAQLSSNASQYLQLNSGLFHVLCAETLKNLIEQELDVLLSETVERNASVSAIGPSTVTFEEMELKVLLGNISQALELEHVDALYELNTRIASLLERDELATAANPFRPQIFVNAIYQAWCKLEQPIATRRIVLHLVGPNLFLRLAPILQQLNQTLIDQLVGTTDHASAPDSNKLLDQVSDVQPKTDKQHNRRYKKVRNMLLSSGKKVNENGVEDLNLPDLFAVNSEAIGWDANTISVKVGPRLFKYLNTLQDQFEACFDLEYMQSGAFLRQVKEHAPAGMLTVVDENTIELLAKIFDYVLQEPGVADDVKRLLARLQVPMLKAALMDKKFFVKESHPARRLFDAVAQSGIGWSSGKVRDDSFFKNVEQIVVRVQREFDQQMSSFSDALAGLENVLESEEKQSQHLLSDLIAKALRQERLSLAEDAAQYDVALRLETGEVASFVETFLETHWVRVLTLTHSVKEKKPEALAKAVQAMDDLIWSIQPKNSPEQRKELIRRLPSILTMVNAWLDAIKWHDPERLVFFSRLAERHAAIVRIQAENSPRHQVEIAVSIAERVSARRMRRRKLEAERQNAANWPQDEHQLRVERLNQGSWAIFSLSEREPVPFKLGWISPKRTRFIFTNRQGQEPFLMTRAELAQALKEKKAVLMKLDSITERALDLVLEEA